MHNSKKDIPRLFDEWQTIPELWDTIRSEVDERRELGQFVLTCSAIGLYGSISFLSKYVNISKITVAFIERI